VTCKEYEIHKLNLFGQKGHVWYQYLAIVWKEIGSECSEVDKFVFYYGNSVLLVYIDDSIIIGPMEEEMYHLIAEVNKHF
jgi:hypothetical protein